MLAIEVKNISKTYKIGFWGKKVKVLNDLSFQVEKGEVFAYLGPNGAGKTTTLKSFSASFRLIQGGPLSSTGP